MGELCFLLEHLDQCRGFVNMLITLGGSLPSQIGIVRRIQICVDCPGKFVRFASPPPGKSLERQGIESDLALRSFSTESRVEKSELR
uniref:Uncharacterized protein n=1 Tax=Oryza sativa subsp. japonica TaxID=39947 RepID=Q5Z7F0_ORYSJ|nr:hypothetical protein [Oryza sativa Japonica Group]